MARSHQILAAIVVLASTVLGRPVAGSPILPSEKKIEDSVLSLAKVRRVEIQVFRLAKELRAAGLSEEDVKARWVKRLAEEHFEVAEGKGYPRLVLRNVATTDPEVPNAVAYVLVVSLEQPVRIEGLDQALFVATFSQTLLGQETVSHLGHAAIINVNQAVNLFIDGVKKAEASRAG